MILFKKGGGLLNSLINKLPVELHIPGYQYCGPGTRLEDRLTRGDRGINPLDRACKEHNIAYSKSKDIKERHKADQILEDRAWDRVKSKDATTGEKASAFIVTNSMKVKRKLGMGLKRRVVSVSPLQQLISKKIRRGKKRRMRVGGGIKKIAFRKSIVKRVGDTMKRFKHNNIKEGAKIALTTAKIAVKEVGGRKRVRTPRIIPIPKTGGFLPLIPLFAGLSALGGLAGGATGIAQAVNKAKAAQQELDEAHRHNQTMESIALGKKGSGLYLKPYRKGLGLFLGSQGKEKKNY